MSKRISELASSLKQIGDVQVNEWDLNALLHKDIGELEITRSLRRLGNLHVLDLDFHSANPAVNKLANREVDIIGFVKRTANHKVMEWDFRHSPPTKNDKAMTKADQPSKPELNQEQLQGLIVHLKNFLQYVALNLIDEPDHAQIKVQELDSKALRFKLILQKRDVAMLIGRGGHTASAIRRLLKNAAGMHGVHALLQIHSHEEEIAAMWAEGDANPD